MERRALLKNKWNALKTACIEGNVAVVKEILKKEKGNVDFVNNSDHNSGATVLLFASVLGHVAVVKTNDFPWHISKHTFRYAMHHL